METLRLARYHAHGNDFVIALLREPELAALDAALAAAGLTRPGLARSVCDRRHGVGGSRLFEHAHGADGFIIGVDRSPLDCVRMHLLNSDGSFAETSGNGLACLALALVDTGIMPAGRVDIETDAGRQWCDVASELMAPRAGSGDAGLRHIGVAMESVGSGPEISPALLGQAQADLGTALRHLATGDVGNPHMVIALNSPIGAARTAELGAAYEQHFDDGMNVEFIWVHDAAEKSSTEPQIMVSVWERGAGLTKACGSGSVVAATLAHEWGMAGDGESVLLATSEFAYSVDLGPEPVLWVTAASLEQDLEFPLGKVRLQPA